MTQQQQERKVIIEKMRDEAPYYLSEGLIPYISEAMDIYANKLISELRKPSEFLSNSTEYCDICDGVGWYEGGTAIKTFCKKCNGNQCYIYKYSQK